jgi:hypothetical protein
MAMALQVMAVIILFGYPGCSSNIKPAEVNPVKASVSTDSSLTAKNSGIDMVRESYIPKVMKQNR